MDLENAVGAQHMKRLIGSVLTLVGPGESGIPTKMTNHQGLVIGRSYTNLYKRREAINGGAITAVTTPIFVVPMKDGIELRAEFAIKTENLGWMNVSMGEHDLPEMIDPRLIGPYGYYKDESRYDRPNMPPRFTFSRLSNLKHDCLTHIKRLSENQYVQIGEWEDVAILSWYGSHIHGDIVVEVQFSGNQACREKVAEELKTNYGMERSTLWYEVDKRTTVTEYIGVKYADIDIFPTVLASTHL